MRVITVKAPVNIAMIKYWGKKDENYIMPLNESISGTLSMDQMCAKTSIAISEKFVNNRMWLNGEEVNIQENKRLLRCLEHVRKVAKHHWKDNEFVHICSENNFPTAAGLASSAAGFAGLVYALFKLLKIEDDSLMSALARIGSGSACRSIYGGLVQWFINDNDPMSQCAKQIFDENYWPQIRVLILVVNDQKKTVSSSIGMQRSVQTSELLKYRAENIVPTRLKNLILAYKNHDFQEFSEYTMKDSNQFHAICQDTYPPINYMNDISWSLVRFIDFLNDYFKENIAAYTFDAGPNACLYCLDKHVPLLLKLIKKLNQNENLEIRGLQPNENKEEIPKILLDYIEKNQLNNGLKFIISTKLGSGPEIISKECDHDNDNSYDCLLNCVGLPKNTIS